MEVKVIVDCLRIQFGGTAESVRTRGDGEVAIGDAVTKCLDGKSIDGEKGLAIGKIDCDSEITSGEIRCLAAMQKKCLCPCGDKTFLGGNSRQMVVRKVRLAEAK